MKNLLVGLALTSSMTVASAAQAQTPATTTAAPAAQAPAAAVTAAPAAAQTSISDMAPLAPSRFGGSASIESSMGVEESQSKNLGSKAPISTAWGLAMKYKTTDKTSVEIQQLAYSKSNIEATANDEKVLQGKRFNLSDVVLRGNLKTDLKLMSSNPMAFNLRYYLPTSAQARLFAKRNGIVRLDTTPGWDLSTKFTFEWYNSLRVTLNSPQSAVGSDAAYRVITGPSLTYNLNDTFNMYVSDVADVRSVNVGRGTWATEVDNTQTTEVGANISIGALTINPSISSDTTFNNGSGSVLSQQSRMFSPETSSYNLNFYATF